ncbi:MAG: transglutaminase N-terminal domain-containing protein [Agromyces sp.]
MSRLRIVHRTGFDYEHPATASYNEVRMLPQTGDEQWVLQAGLDIRPVAAQHSYQDYWGSRVSTFEVLTPHTELSVTATSVVESRERAEDLTDIEWDELPALADRDTMFVEFGRQTALTEPPAELRTLVKQLRKRRLGVRATAREILTAIGEAIQYTPGSTGVHTSAADAWAGRTGVCQDFAHLAIGALREAGIPARYVSGYLHPRPDAALGETVAGESHAWVEYFAGSWQGYDPTNLIEIGERHVHVARGRDYADVSPLRGVYAGPSTSSLFVTVEITREA